MDLTKIRDWESSVDKAEQTSMAADLPTDLPLGQDFMDPQEDGTSRHWKRVEVVSGNVGARWAYWTKQDEFKVVADRIFNGDVAHFAGMLAVPFTGKIPGMKHEMWMLISPRLTPPKEERIYEEKPKERYEKSKEVYDVDSHTSRDLNALPKPEPEIVTIPTRPSSAGDGVKRHVPRNRVAQD